MTGSTRSGPCEGDTGTPCGMTPPLAQRPDPPAAALATAPCQSSTRWRATRSRSLLPWQPRRDGAGRCDTLPRPRVRTRPARRPSRAERRRTARPGCKAHQSDEQSGHSRGRQVRHMSVRAGLRPARRPKIPRTLSADRADQAKLQDWAPSTDLPRSTRTPRRVPFRPPTAHGTHLPTRQLSRVPPGRERSGDVLLNSLQTAL
jgi:hypothetical protein